MAPGSHFYYSPYVNSLINLIDNELASNHPVTHSKSGSFLRLISCILSLELTRAPILTPTIFSINNKLFIQFIKAYLAVQI